MRKSWTDDRLDEFGRRIDERFDRVDGEIAALRSEMEEGNRASREEFAEMRKDIRALHEGLLSLQTTMVKVGGAGIVALMGFLITTQL